MEIHRLIRRLLRKHKTNCPYRLAAALNIEVWFEDLGEGTRGMFRRTMRRKYIVIHSGLSDVWKRVICAHELAHALLHPGVSRFWMDQNTFFCIGRYEREANCFAVSLLTAGDLLGSDETVYDLFTRNGIPDEMIQFYI